MARVHGQPIAVLGDPAQGVDVGDVEAGIDAVGEQVHRQVDDVDVAGAFAVAEQRALDAVGAGHHTELGGGDGAAAIVVRVQRQHDVLASADRASEPLDDVAVDVGGVALHGRRQVEDDRSVVAGLDDVHHPFADLDGEVGLGEREALRRVLVAQRRGRVLLLELAAQLGGVDGDVDDAGLVEAEHDSALQRVRRVVEVDDRTGCSLDALVGALDELLAALREHLDRHVVGDPVLGDELADEVEVGLARRREADLDLLEPHRHEGVEHVQLARRVHRVDQRLVAVAEVDGAPQRRRLDDAVGPRAVGEDDRHVGRVLRERHRGGRLLSGCGGMSHLLRKMKKPPGLGGGRARTR